MAEALAELLDANLSEGQPAQVGWTVQSVIADLRAEGLTLRQTRTQLAELLSGTDEKGSRAYRSARRQAERWTREGRRAPRLRPESQQRVSGARRQRTERMGRFRAHGAQMRILVLWGSQVTAAKRKPEWLPPNSWQHITTRTMRSVIRYWADDDLQLAAGLLLDAFLTAYKVPNIDDWEADIEVLDLRLEPSR